MDSLQRHIAGASRDHVSPFSDLVVPERYEPLPPAIDANWVQTLYLNLDDPEVDTFLAGHLSQADDALIALLLSHVNWRSRVTGAQLAVLRDRHVFTRQIGQLLLRSDVWYAGKAYCVTLADFNNSESLSFLKQYLDYYLERTDLHFDQDYAMSALAYLDKTNGTHHLDAYLPAWERFVGAQDSWEPTYSVRFVERTIQRLRALRTAHGS